MRTESDTLIITSCLKPSSDVPFLKIQNPALRLQQLCCCLLAWAEEESIKRIIVGDNSDPNYDFALLEKALAENGKQLEVLFFQGDRERTVERGKGHGEGEILRYVMENSRLIQSCETFFKVTGRVYVKNFGEIHKFHSNDRRVFDNPVQPMRRFAKRIAVRIDPNSRHGIGRVNTVLYKCDREFFMSHLVNQSEVVDDHVKGRTLEHVYFKSLIRHGFTGFKSSPIFVGRSGTTGRLYTDSSDYSPELKMRAEKLSSSIMGDVKTDL